MRAITFFLLCNFIFPFLLGCRAITVISGDLFVNDPLVQSESILSDAVNNTGGENHIMLTSMMAGASTFQHSINLDIYSKDMVNAFGKPDVVVLSFGINDIGWVRSGQASYDSVLEAFWTLVHQAVQAGATCIIVAEWSHQYRSVDSGEHPGNAELTPLMDQWFLDIERRAGENEFLGFPYFLVFADVSELVHNDMDRYIRDDIQPTVEGAQLMADAVVTALAQCPEGRWVYNEGRLKEGFELRVPWHLQTSNSRSAFSEMYPEF